MPLSLCVPVCFYGLFLQDLHHQQVALVILMFIFQTDRSFLNVIQQICDVTKIKDTTDWHKLTLTFIFKQLTHTVLKLQGLLFRVKILKKVKNSILSEHFLKQCHCSLSFNFRIHNDRTKILFLCFSSLKIESRTSKTILTFLTQKFTNSIIESTVVLQNNRF